MTTSQLYQKLLIKNITLSVILMILLLGSSCQKEPHMRFGFDTDFGKNAQGLTIINVGGNTKSINLKGEVCVYEGEVLVELIDPCGRTVFSSHLLSPDSQYLNESFHALSGNWKLKYRSIEGEGTIILHLNIADKKH
jgi:hypothetical protein